MRWHRRYQSFGSSSLGERLEGNASAQLDVLQTGRIGDLCYGYLFRRTHREQSTDIGWMFAIQHTSFHLFLMKKLMRKTEL